MHSRLRHKPVCLELGLLVSQYTDEMPRISGKRNESSHLDLWWDSQHIYTFPLLKVIFLHCFNGAVCPLLMTAVKFQNTAHTLSYHIPYLFLHIIYVISHMRHFMSIVIVSHLHSAILFVYTILFFFFHCILALLLYLFIFILITFV